MMRSRLWWWWRDPHGVVAVGGGAARMLRDLESEQLLVLVLVLLWQPISTSRRQKVRVDHNG